MSSLDDFFAKKDRKKKGIKSDGLKSDKDAQKDKVASITDNFKYISDNKNEEWLDFEENRDKDYSGLKIQTLSLKDKEQVLHEQRQAELDEAKNDGEAAWTSSKASSGAKTEEPAVEEAKKDEAAVEKKDEPVKPQKYIPPSLRSSSSTTQEMPKRVPKNKMPEIKSQNEFPSLG